MIEIRDVSVKPERCRTFLIIVFLFFGRVGLEVCHNTGLYNYTKCFPVFGGGRSSKVDGVNMVKHNIP